MAIEAIALDAPVAADQAEDDVAQVLGAVAADAQSHLEVLGGVWEPPPRPDEQGPAQDAAGTSVGDDRGEGDGDNGEGDDGGAHPGILVAGGLAGPAGAGARDEADNEDADNTGDGATDPDEVLTLLETTSPGLRADLETIDGDLARLLTSISVNQDLHARNLREALELDPLEAPGLPDDPFPAELDEQEAAPLIRMLDASGYVAEVRAARSSGDQRTALVEQAQRMREQAELLAVRTGVAATEQDPRAPAYELDLQDLAGQAEDLASSGVPAWMNLVAGAEGSDRDLIATQVLLNARGVYDGSEPPPTFPGLAGVGE